jgi:hypothetical protein
MNGDEYSYFNSQSSSSGTAYQNAVNAAKSNPSGGSRKSPARTICSTSSTAASITTVAAGTGPEGSYPSQS